MAAGRYDLTIEQGATFQLQCQWQDSSGNNINLTGYTISGKIRRRTSDTQPLVSFTTNITSAVNGQFIISLTAAQTALLPTAHNSTTAEKQLLECVYDVEAVSGATVYRLFEGLVKVSPEVTR